VMREELSAVSNQQSAGKEAKALVWLIADR
jgi:hypothetical protein